MQFEGGVALALDALCAPGTLCATQAAKLQRRAVVREKHAEMLERLQVCAAAKPARHTCTTAVEHSCSSTIRYRLSGRA